MQDKKEKKDKLTLIITDTHFGVKANSMTWLREQTEVFEKQIIPFLKLQHDNYNHIDIVHCGDLFDSRSSISPYVIYHVSNILKNLCNLCDEMIIIGGNHDYYSPNENEEYNINSLDLLPNIEHLTRCTQSYVRRGQNLYIPWFSFENKDTLRTILERNTQVRNIFCHTDLERLDGETKELLSSYQVFSGHIHKPLFSDNFYTLGALFPFTFADSNQCRFFYTIENDDAGTIKGYDNKVSIKFWRLYGEDVLNYENYNIDKMDQVELYIEKSCVDSIKYQNAIEFCNKNFNTNVIITEAANILEASQNNIVLNEEYNIIQACEDMIPKKLQSKFNKLRKKLGSM